MRYFFTYDTISENTEVSRRTGIATSTISDWRKKKINPQIYRMNTVVQNIHIVEIERYNVFHTSLIVRHSEDKKLYLYDILDIKKETIFYDNECIGACRKTVKSCTR